MKPHLQNKSACQNLTTHKSCCLEPNPWLAGKAVTLPEVLDAREYRWHRQQQLLSQYGGTLICLTLNIPGPIKNFPLAVLAFREGMSAIEQELSVHQCKTIHKEHLQENTGCVGFIVITENAGTCKEWMTKLEETHSLGRIFDIDILNSDGQKISRKDIGHSGRTCLLCGRPAFECGRSRTHSAQELWDRVVIFMRSFFIEKLSEQIAGLFTKAMTYEVTVSPKPGLVDRWHNGAHHDMNIDLFMDSIEALFPYFRECSMLGAIHTCGDYPNLFTRLRPLGIQAEKEMYQATGNVNTHKGLIFSGGILCAAAAHVYVNDRAFDYARISSLCKKMLVSLHKDFDNPSPSAPQTHGERLYLEHGLKGIRGEAMEGYPTLFSIGLPTFTKCRTLGFPLYKSGRITLLYLIAHCEDTNIIIRSSFETWKKIAEHLKKYLHDTPLSDIKDEEVISKLDDFFIKNNISPGGSADLLALVYFLYFILLYHEHSCITQGGYGSV